MPNPLAAAAAPNPPHLPALASVAITANVGTTVNVPKVVPARNPKVDAGGHDSDRHHGLQ